VIEHFVSRDGCSERECWVRKPSVHASFSILTFLAKDFVNNPGYRAGRSMEAEESEMK
jgi:hypothetical protein